MLLVVSMALGANPTPTTDCPCDDVSSEAVVRRPPSTPVSVGVLGGADVFRAGGPTAPALGAVLAVAASDVLSVEVSGTMWPGGADDGDFRRSYVQDPIGVPLDVTRPVASGGARLIFTPLRGALNRPGHAEIALDTGLGFGAIYTVDDLAALQSEDDSVAVKTANQLHPTLGWTAGPRVSVSERTSFTLRLQGQHWIETFESLNLERMSRVDLTAGVRLRI